MPHNLIFGAAIEVEGIETIGYLCDENQDKVADTLYYVADQLKYVAVAALNDSQIEKIAVTKDIYNISTSKNKKVFKCLFIKGQIGPVFIEISNPNINASKTLLQVYKGNVELSNKNFWHSSDNKIHILDFNVNKNNFLTCVDLFLEHWNIYFVV